MNPVAGVLIVVIVTLALDDRPGWAFVFAGLLVALEVFK